MDLALGYFGQVPLTEAAKEKTAFITPSESGQFNRMMFGLINAPYEFSLLETTSAEKRYHSSKYELMAVV